MTEIMFQKLEEKMMMVLSEVEVSRSEIENLKREVQRLNQENSALKFEKENNTQKLQGLISLLDTMNLVDNAMPTTGVPVGKPILVQG